MTSPVFRALVSARLQQLTRDEAAISEDVNAALGPKPADTHRPARFIRWCEDQSLPWRPAQPATIAKWVLSHTETKHLPDELRTLALSYTSQGLPDPTSAWPVGEALSRVVKVETPRSWPKDMQVLFLSLLPIFRRRLLREKKSVTSR